VNAAADPQRYFAFISYSHQDESWAQWLHKALETWRVPSRLVGQATSAGTIPNRLLPIFRDREELASATDLGRTVNAALAQSKNLIVICSPNSAKSRWVNEEVLAFKRLGNAERIFCLIVGGEPDASDIAGREAEECFAPALRFTLDSAGKATTQRTEPIAADARDGKDGKANAKLKLIAGLLDVGYDVLKQRELQRRNRRLAALSIAALIIMAITTTLAITAVIARGDAERRQKQAEELVGFMLGDLNDKLREVSRLDILEAVDDKAMAYFRSLPTNDVTDATLEQRAKALEKIGSVRFDQGHLQPALESFNAALTLAGRLAQAAPSDLPRQIAYSRVWSYVGMTQWFQGNLDDAQSSFESSQGVLKDAEVKSEEPGLIYQLLVVDNNLGHVLETRGKTAEAEEQYRRMLARAERLVARADATTEWKSQLAAAHNNLGKVALARGDLETAISQYRADDAIMTELSARDPKDNNARFDMFTVRAILGRTLALAGDVAGGTRALREAVDIAMQVATHDPTFSGVQENLALYQMQLGRLLRLSGELPEAMALTDKALQAFTALTNQDSENSRWQREFAEVRIERAWQYHSANQAAEAQRFAQGALDSLNPLFSKQTTDRSLLLATVGARLLIADLTSDAATRTRLRGEALSAIEAVKSGADDPRLLALRVEALLGLGRRDEAAGVIRKLWDAGYRDPALVALLRRADVDYPPNKEFEQRLEKSIAQRRT